MSRCVADKEVESKWKDILCAVRSILRNINLGEVMFEIFTGLKLSTINSSTILSYDNRKSWLSSIKDNWWDNVLFHVTTSTFYGRWKQGLFIFDWADNLKSGVKCLLKRKMLEGGKLVEIRGRSGRYHISPRL